MSNEKKSNVSRRSFLKGIGSSAVATTVVPSALVGGAGSAIADQSDGFTNARIDLKINGKNYEVDVETRTTLLSVLREHTDTHGNLIDLTGAKPICEHGACGGCTVLIGGKSIYSCMTLAIDSQNTEITTVEGLANGDRLHPVQEAFVKHDALQCGFCTPGFVVAAKAFLDQNPDPTRDEIKNGLAGNVCRCGTYPFIFDAVETATKIKR